MDIFLRIDNFEGPLDLLLQLIEKNKLDIAEIKISQLIDEYLFILNQNKKENFDIKIEFLVVASELLEIKALSILDIQDEEDKENEFKKRLEEYKLFKILSSKFSELENEYNISYSRGEGRKIIKKISKEYDLSKLNPSDIFSSYSKYLEIHTEFLELNLDKSYTLKDEMEKVYERIFFSNTTFDYIFSLAENRTHLIYIFLSILDLYKDGRILILENELKINKNFKPNEETIDGDDIFS